MTTVACDVLVFGSSLGGFVAGAYAARAGLRVTLLEEESHAKRPPLLREPFLLSGAGMTGPIDGVLHELGAGPLKRRELLREPPALQVALPDARVALGGGSKRTADELTGYRLGSRDAIHRWLEAVLELGDASRGALVAAGAPDAGTRSRSASLRARFRPLRLPGLALRPVPPGPERVDRVLAALAEGLSYQADLKPREAPALLVRGTLDEGIRGVDAVSGVLDLLRRRYTSLGGKIQPASSPLLFGGRREFAVDLGREQLVARALVLAAPGHLLRERVAADESSRAWLREAPPALPIPTRLVRAQRSALSSGMGMRVVDATDPKETRWLTRTADPAEAGVEWVILRGSTLPSPSGDDPLGPLAPFARGRLQTVDPGPDAGWDLGGAEVRIAGPGWRALRARSPLILSVGPDVAPALGVEGETLGARRVGIWLGERLAAPLQWTGEGW